MISCWVINKIHYKLSRLPKVGKLNINHSHIYNLVRTIKKDNIYLTFLTNIGR